MMLAPWGRVLTGGRLSVIPRRVSNAELQALSA